MADRPDLLDDFRDVLPTARPSLSHIPDALAEQDEERQERDRQKAELAKTRAEERQQIRSFLESVQGRDVYNPATQHLAAEGFYDADTIAQMDPIHFKNLHDLEQMVKLMESSPTTREFFSGNPHLFRPALDELTRYAELEKTARDSRMNIIQASGHAAHRGGNRLLQLGALYDALAKTSRSGRLESTIGLVEELGDNVNYQSFIEAGGDQRDWSLAQQIRRIPDPEGRRQFIEDARQAAEESVTEFSRRTEILQSIPLSAEEQRFFESIGWSEGLRNMLNPNVMAGLVAESLVQFSPALVIGAATAGAGALPVTAATFSTSALLEYGSQITESMVEAGVDTSSPESIIKALSDEDTLNEWKLIATKKALPVAVMESVSVLSAGQLIRLGRSTRGRIGLAATEALGVQPGFGATGAILGGLWAHGEVDPIETLAEIGGAIGPGIVETMTGASRIARADRVRSEAANIIQSARDQVTLDKVLDAADSLTLNQDSPQAFADLVNRDFEGQNVYIDMRILKDNVDSLPPELATLVNDLDVDASISIGEFASIVVKDKALLDTLRPHVKLRPDAKTANDFATTEDIMKPLMDSYRADAAAQVEASQLVNQLFDQLVETGRVSPQQAKYSAVVIPAYLVVKAKQTGIPVSELWERMKLTIVGPESVAQTEGQTILDQNTPEFKAWFGDSKVVDENGAPRQVYHGTATNFEAFGQGEPITEGGADLRSRGVSAFFFTPDPDAAADYASAVPGSQRTSGDQIIPVYLSLQNPLVIDAEGRGWGEFQDQIEQAYASAEYDGVILENVEDGMFDAAVGTTYIAFRPDQIKSAITLAQPSTPLRRGTPGFKAWFGESKVVDENGEPRKMVHVTGKDFNVFKTDNQMGAHFGTPEQSNRFTDWFGTDARSMQVYLSIQNPLRLEDIGSFDADFVIPQLERLGLWTEEDQQFYEVAAGSIPRENAVVKDAIKRAGYDGIVYLNRREGVDFMQPDGVDVDDLNAMTDEEVMALAEELGEEPQDSYIAFDPTQIKSAIGNSGAFDPANPSILAQSSIPLRRGTQTLRKYGVKPGEALRVRDLAAALERRQRDKAGTIEKGDYSPEAVSKMAKWMAEEIMFELDQDPTTTGVDWYGAKFQRALDVFGERFPELLTDQDARDVFTVFIAITSDGAKVTDNFAHAAEIYETYRDGGWGGVRQNLPRSSMASNLEVFAGLVEEMGVRPAVEYLLQEETVTKLRRIAKSEGITFNTAYKADTKLPMAAVAFGPKLGAFYANLMGRHGYLTMDRWWSRTFNRMRGTLIPEGPTASSVKAFAELLGMPDATLEELIPSIIAHRDAYAASNFKDKTPANVKANTIHKVLFENINDTPFNASDREFMIRVARRAQSNLKRRGVDMSIADIQATMWYYEKKLYMELGADASGTVSYEEAARNVLRKSARPDDQGVAETLVETPEGTLIGVESQQETLGTGQDFDPFFGSVTLGETGVPTLGQYEPTTTAVTKGLADPNSRVRQYHNEYDKHHGNFDDHIALSIPGYRDHQYAIGLAVLDTFDSGVMLDIGASEGTQAKTITALSDGNIQTIALDPNLPMQQTYETKSKVEGSEFELAALGMRDETGQAWVDEDTGTSIPYFDPQGRKYDIVQAAMVFQFINNDRPAHIERLAELTADDGVAIIQEKMITDMWDQNELKKNRDYKSKYFSQEDMSIKATEVLEGMNKNLVDQQLLERSLRANFKYVGQIWDSGNFKGYVATNSKARFDKFMGSLIDTRSEFDTRGMPPLTIQHAGIVQDTTLNVGLNTPDGDTISVGDITSALTDLGIGHTVNEVRSSNTEPTAIVTIDRQLSVAEVDSLADRLGQQAIAMLTPDGGYMGGPQTALWGEFNIDFFLLPGQQDTTLFQSEAPRRNNLGLYSMLEKAALQMHIPQWKNDGEATGRDIMAKLSKMAGVKAEEIVWSGIEEVLTTDPNAKFTRAQVVEMIRKGGVRVEVQIAREGEEGSTLEWSDGTVLSLEDHNPDYRDYLEELFDIGGYDTEVRRMIRIMTDEERIAVSETPWEEDLKPFREFFKEDIVNEAYEQEVFDYNQDPVIEFTLDEQRDDVRVLRLPEGRYELIVVGTRQYELGATSTSEALVQASNILRSEGLVSGAMDGEARYQGYVAPGESTNYREVKVMLPDVPGVFTHSHFDETNIVGFTQVTDRMLSIGPVEADPPTITTVSYEIVDSPVKDAIHKRVLVIKRADTGEKIYSTGAYQDEAAMLAELESKIAKPGTRIKPGMFINDDGMLQIDPPNPVSDLNSYHIEALQSDWHQLGRRVGYEGDQGVPAPLPIDMLPELTKAWVKLNDLRKAAAAEVGKLLLTEPMVTSVDRADADLKSVDPKLRSTDEYAAVVDLSNQYFKARGNVGTPPPQAPFKGDAWISLMLKTALVNAVEEGADALSWSDSETQIDLWSPEFRTLYENTYNQKMVSIVKKLTGIDPVQRTLSDGGRADPPPPAPYKVEPRGDGWAVVRIEDGEVMRTFILEEAAKNQAKSLNIEESPAVIPGYWIIPITPELRARIQDESFPLFQGERGSLTLTPHGDRIMRLGRASDESTFLHEAAHLFLEFEKDLAAEFGITDDQQAILAYLGARSFDDIDPSTPRGVEMHEKFARSFEAYLREGKAPSLALRDAFAAFARWLTRIYRQLVSLDVTLTPEIRAVFDRMLATQAEIDAAQSNPIYDQFFKDAKAAGMTEQEFAKYRERQSKAANRAESTLWDKVTAEIRQRKTQWWRDQVDQLADEASERLGSEPIYQLLADLVDAPMDHTMATEAYGQKLPGNLIGKARKDGIDPVIYAETYGFDSVQEMVREIANTQPLRKAALAEAEQTMLERHGDMLNDGTIEQEAREVVQDEARAEQILEDIKILRKLSRSRGQEINRDYLKAQAATMIGNMKYREIHPHLFYKAVVRAAKAAVDAKTPQEKLQFKIQELTNHYLYREALGRREAADRHRRYINKAKAVEFNMREMDPGYAVQFMAVANMYDMRKSDQQKAIGTLLDWYHTQLLDPNNFVKPELLDPNLVLALEARERGELTMWTPPRFDELSVDDVRAVYEQLKALRHLGRMAGAPEKARRTEERLRLQDSILAAKTTVHSQNRQEPRLWEEARRSFQHMINKLPSLRNLIRVMDGFEEFGAAWDLVYKRVEDANGRKMALNKELYDRFRSEMADIHKVGISRLDSVTLQRADGTSWTLSLEGRFMLALYWGTESSRQAIMEGHNVTEADVVAMLETMSKDQLEMVNATWRVNESLWPQLSEVATRVYGFVPPKLPATPFVVNGVEMTGGHQRLYYDSQELELKTDRVEGGSLSNIMPTKAGTLHSRVGSGGRIVRLDRNNIARALNEVTHAIAFAEVGLELQSLVNSRQVQAAIENRHGKGFTRALVENIESIVTARKERESIAFLAHTLRYLRRNATFAILSYSIRNVVQQVSAVVVGLAEVGPIEFMGHFIQQMVPGTRGEMFNFVNERSPFMMDRASVVNREAASYLREISIDNPATHLWSEVGRHGFVLQTFVDRHIAYPVWMAKYEQVMAATNDEAKAISAANVAVSETVGSGSDLHMGGAFQSTNTELVKSLTMFGSWFNAMYNRLYRSTKGFKSLSPETLRELTILPLAMALIEAAVTQAWEEDDWEDEEAFLQWMAVKYGSFMAGTIPYLRDIVGFGLTGYAPKTMLQGGAEAPTRFAQEIASTIEGDQTVVKGASDILKVLRIVAPMPGVSNVTRTLDYIDSFEAGNEPGEFNAYQAIIKGPSR